MSKQQLNEFLNLSDEKLEFLLKEMDLADLRIMIRCALIEQDKDTRHACAQSVVLADVEGFTREGILKSCTTACINTKDGLKGV